MVVKDNLYAPFEIVLKELMDVCPRPVHRHTFFELVYIVSGSGKQRINDSRIAYHARQLFLLTPEDVHCFDIVQPTQFLFIRFNESYIRSGRLPKDAVERLEFILKNASHDPGCVLRHEPDKAFVQSLMKALITELSAHDLYNKELLEQYVNTLIVLVARNIAKSLPVQVDEQTDDKAIDILQYIQTNIYHPEKIRAEYISRHFGISETYLGRYFKKHASETMQQYITRYKLKLIESRLLHSNLRISEIADEFGFTDKSHLNRIFKKYKGISPGEYKRAAHHAPVV